MATAIEFDHVGKQYRLGLVTTKTLSHDLNRWWQTSILGKEDPYLKISETNDRATAGSSEYVWALKDIDFKVEQGDVVGIIGKMRDVSKGEGRTVLFVSHNMTSIKSLCKHGIILQNGMIIDQGEIDPIVTHYLRGENDVDNYKKWEKDFIGVNGFQLLEIGIRKRGGTVDDVMRMDDELELFVRYRLTRPVNSFWITFHLKNDMGNKLFSFTGGGRCYDRKHEAGEYYQTCIIPKSFLNWGNYALDFMALEQDRNITDMADENDILVFTVANRAIELGGYMGREPGDITPKVDFSEERIG